MNPKTGWFRVLRRRLSVLRPSTAQAAIAALVLLNAGLFTYYRVLQKTERADAATDLSVSGHEPSEKVHDQGRDQVGSEGGAPILDPAPVVSPATEPVTHALPESPPAPPAFAPPAGKAQQQEVAAIPSGVPSLSDRPVSEVCTVRGLDPNGNNWLALRDGPSFQASWSTTHMGPGTPVTVFGRQGEWRHVRIDNGEEGWANSRFLHCDGSAGPSQPTSRVGRTCQVDGLDPNGNNWLALRHAPSFKASWSSTHLGPGTPVRVLETSGEWRHVRLENGENGWANARFLRCD